MFSSLLRFIRKSPDPRDLRIADLEEMCRIHEVEKHAMRLRHKAIGMRLSLVERQLKQAKGGVL